MINADDMQSWAYLLAPTFQFVNTAGKPLTEGWLEVYIAGTRDKYYCASDFNGTLHPFQIPLDSLGANIVLADPDQAYDVYVYNKYGSLIMSRYHVSPGMAGGSGVLNITITSEDGTVSVNNDGNGNFDLSIQDTVDRIEVLEQTVSGLSANSSVGYAIAHAYTVELDGSFDLINDAVTGIGYTPNMDGFRLKSGHVYQFNFNALFENGAFDRNCSGKLYLEGPNTIAQEWKFDLDDSYYHSQSINGSTVLVTPNDLNYYDVKLKLAWDVDYPNKPNVDLNKISIVDITTLLRSNSASGTGGDYIAGDGIFINDETNVISVDMDYINSHLDFDDSSIIASAVNIATAYTDARVTTVSGDLVNLIAEVSASIPTGTVTQVQSDWTEQDSSSPAYIQHKPDLSVYATHDEVSGVSAVLNERINDVSGSIPELPEEEEVEFEEIDLSDYALASAIPDVSDFVTHDEVSAVSGNIIEYVNSVSGDLVETINNVSGDIIHTVETVSGDIIETITTVSGDIIETVNNVSGDIIETITTVSGDIINTVETVSAVLEGDIVSAIQVATGAIPEQVNADWNAVSGKAEILNKPDLSIYATHDELVDAVTAVSSMIPTDYVTHNEVSAVSANLVNYVNSVSGDITNYVDESIVSAINVATGSFEQVQSDWTEDDTNDPSYIQNKPNEIEIVAGQNIGIFSDATTITIAASATDLSGLATHSEVNTVSGILESEIQAVSAAIGEQVPNVSIQSPSGTLVVNETVSGNNKIYSIDVAPTSGIEYGQFYATNITGAATMARTKGNIDITNDGKIKLKKGQSYHITVRGRYNQSVLKDNYAYASYIEYVTNNSININVDESRSGSQYFELSYDLFKLNSDTDYYVFFTLDDATVNDLFIEVHSLANVGGNGSSGGSSPEYDAGYGIQILNNVISVSGIAPQVQSDWNQTNTSSVDYIKNKPEEYGLLAGDNISITASGNNFIISSTASSVEPIDYQAGYGIDITGNTISVDASIIPSTSAYATHTEVNNVSAAIIAQIPEQQVNSDWTATSGVAEILNKPNESELIAGAGVSITASGNNYIISAVVTGSPVISGYVTEAELETVSGNIVSQIPDVSNLATKTEVQAVETNVQIVSAAIPTLPTEEEVEFEEVDLSDYALASSIPNVSGFATVELVSAVSGKLPTTELGKFTIQNNVSGGPIEVICPTDQAPDVVFYQINSVSGNAYAPGESIGVINYYYGETPADFNGSDDGIQFTINDNISNIGAIAFYYTTDASGVGGPDLSTTKIVGDSTGGIVQSGTYKVKAQYNAAGTSSPYGKYLQIMFKWRNWASDAAQSLQWTQNALSKITFFGVVRPDPSLGVTVNLDRYALGNTSTISNTSGYTQATIYTDPITKKQSVYLPSRMPSNWMEQVNVLLKYGTTTTPNVALYTYYGAYKQESGTSNMQYAVCVDHNWTNKIMTFIAFDKNGNAFEKWTYNWGTSPKTWTTETISSGSTYTAGAGIDITNNVISVDNTVALKTDLPVVTGYIPYSASGVSLPNSKFEIDTNGQAYKVITAEHIDTETATYTLDDQYIQWCQLVVKNQELSVHIGDTISVNNLDSRITSVDLYFYKNGGTTHWQVNNVTVTNNTATFIADRDNVYTDCTITLYVNDIPDGWTTNSETLTITHTEVTPAVKEEYITETALTEAISAVTGAVVYQAGDYIGITDDTISVTGITDLVAGDNITITASGSSAIISSNCSGDVTLEELATVSGALETEIQVVSAAIPSLPSEEEVEFEELDLSDYALASAIPDVTQYATHSEVNTVSGTIVALIPDVSNLASKSEVNSVSGTLQTEIVAISGAMVDVPTGVSGVVAGQGIAITASGSDYVISCTVTGGGSGDVTRAELIAVSGNLETEIQVVSAAIPDTSDMATKTWVGQQGYLTSVPATYVTDTELNSAVSGLATKTEVNSKQNTLTGITDVQVVQALPASPVSSVLYLIPET